MKTYTVLLAEDVPHYGTAHITAASAAEALEASRHLDTGNHCTDPDSSNAVCRRIVHIEAEEGTIVAENIPLDGCFLRYGGEPDRLLCDTAPRLLDALTKIAAIPLWGEPIADEQLKAELIDTGEYDRELDQFEPSCDTESAYLRDAVEIARAALAEMREAPTITDDTTQPQTEGTNT
jgi:hypothetical protein